MQSRRRVCAGSFRRSSRENLTLVRCDCRVRCAWFCVLRESARCVCGVIRRVGLCVEQQPLFVWCPERDQTWVLRRLVSEDAAKGEVVVALDGSGEHTQRFRREDVHPFDESHSFDLDDVAKVNNLHEAPLLDMLSRRYDMDKIYTYAANVLISINPYKHIPFLYDIGDAPVEIDPENPMPHVYTVSEKAFQALKSAVTAGSKQLDHPRDQSVIVSGESGAGKTEASK